MLKAGYKWPKAGFNILCATQKNTNINIVHFNLGEKTSKHEYKFCLYPDNFKWNYHK